MAIKQKNIATTDTQVLEVTGSATSEWAITTVLVCNTLDPLALDSTVVNATRFDMFVVKNGEARSYLTNCILRKVSVEPGDTFTLDSEKFVLGIGDQIIAVAYEDSAFDTSGTPEPTSLACTVSYLEVNA